MSVAFHVFRHFGARTLASFGLLAAGAVPTLAAEGAWIPGSSFDPSNQVASYFARYVAPPGEGQMTVRCDTADGLTIDAAVTGNGEAPSGVEIGDVAEASILLFGAEGAPSAEPFSTKGEVRIRPDGAVLIVMAGEDAGRLGNALLVPSQKAEITIGGTTGSVSLHGASDAIAIVAGACKSWPR